MKISAKKLRDFLEDGFIYSATFVKRTNGEERTLTGRIDVQKQLKCGGMFKFNPIAKNLVFCYDFEDAKRNDKFHHRFINCDSVKKLVVNGKTYEGKDLEKFV